MIKRLLPVALWCAATTPQLACAAEGWSGEAALGVLSTTGNTESRSINGKMNLDYQTGNWKNSLTAAGVNTANAEETTAELYTVGDKLDYSLSEHSYLFVAVDYEKDLFGGIRERTAETAGYGYRLLTGPVHQLDLELGAGARQTEEQGTGIQESEAIGRAGGKYLWTLSPTSSLGQTLKVESGSSNTFTETVSELKLSVVGPIFVGLSFTWRNNSDVPAGTDKTDTFTAVNLSYAFGKT